MKLKPCPFCGKPAERKTNRKYKKGYAATVGCTSQLCPAKIEQATLGGSIEDAYKHAESAWNARPQPDNPPLTLDQLRQINEEPVWLQDLESPKDSEWKICYWDRGRYCVLVSTHSRGHLMDEYGKTWVCYAYKL